MSATNCPQCLGDHEARLAAMRDAFERARAKVQMLRGAVANHKRRIEATHGPGSGSAPDRELWKVLP